MMPQTAKENTDSLDLTKIKNFGTSKDTIRKWKDKAQNANMSTSQAPAEVLVFRV